jgi:hypothetical protein
MRFEVVTILNMNSSFSWGATLCILVEVYERFGAAYCLRRQCRKSSHTKCL